MKNEIPNPVEATLLKPICIMWETKDIFKVFWFYVKKYESLINKIGNCKTFTTYLHVIFKVLWIYVR